MAALVAVAAFVAALVAAFVAVIAAFLEALVEALVAAFVAAFVADFEGLINIGTADEVCITVVELGDVVILAIGVLGLKTKRPSGTNIAASITKITNIIINVFFFSLRVSVIYYGT